MPYSGKDPVLDDGDVFEAFVPVRWVDGDIVDGTAAHDETANDPDETVNGIDKQLNDLNTDPNDLKNDLKPPAGFCIVSGHN